MTIVDPVTQENTFTFQRQVAVSKDGRIFSLVIPRVRVATFEAVLLRSIAKFSSLWGEELFADATIVMGQKTWHVHRCVICRQSKYFEKALEGKFQVSKANLPLGSNELLTN